MTTEKDAELPEKSTHQVHGYSKLETQNGWNEV